MIAAAAARALCALIPFRKKRKQYRKFLLNRINSKKQIGAKSHLLTTFVDARSFEHGQGNPLSDYFINNRNGDIHKYHHYFPIYHKHFSRFRGSPVNVLEIGVAQGGSLKMWKEYFGKEANIYGLDIDPEAKKYENKEEGIHICIGDQGDRDFMERLMETLPEITVLIDDGGHTTLQQTTTFLACYDKLADDGVYLCEDLHTNYWSPFIDTKETFVEYIIGHIHALNYWFDEKHDHSQWAEKTPPSMKIPKFTNITHGISFYNSVIVLEKERIVAPFVEAR